MKLCQGGVSYNQSPNSKGGVKQTFKCALCGRIYKMEQARDRHQRLCADYRKARGAL